MKPLNILREELETLYRTKPVVVTKAPKKERRRIVAELLDSSDWSIREALKAQDEHTKRLRNFFGVRRYIPRPMHSVAMKNAWARRNGEPPKAEPPSPRIADIVEVLYDLPLEDAARFRAEVRKAFEQRIKEATEAVERLRSL